jgi:hypothetical protein
MLVAAALAPAAAHAQCVGHIVDPEQGYAFTPDGFTDTVAGVVAWDPDGDGPSAPWTVFNGTFRRAATAIGNGMVAFDGRSWTGFDLPDSLGATPGVRQTFVHDGALYAVNAMFDDAVGSARVWRRWDGAAWSSVGPLVVNTTDSASNPARVVSFGGDIIAIGLAGYQTGESNPAPRTVLARQNRSQGTLWESIGPPRSEFNGTVHAAVVGSGPGEEGESLYLGGSFVGMGVGGLITNIARWDGTQMHALGAGLIGQVTDIFVDDANVYVAGTFTQSGDTPMVGVAKWNGSTWQQVGDGSITNTQSVAVHDGVVYAVARQGTFDNVYRLEGGQWMIDARTDLAAPPSTTAAPSLVSLEVANGALYMVGRFRGVNARAMQAAAVRLDEPVGPIGAVWKPVSGGFNRPIANMVRWQSRVLAQGNFTRAGKDFALWLAEWDGERWSESNVPTPPGTPGALATMVVVDGALFALAANPARVFEFDGEEWLQIGDAITTVGGTPATVGSLVRFQTQLYAAVSDPFANGGGVRLQRWNGTQWEGVGGLIQRQTGNPFIVEIVVVQDLMYLHVYADTLDGDAFTGGLLTWDGRQMDVLTHDASTPIEIMTTGGELEAILSSGVGSSPMRAAALHGTQWLTTASVPEGAAYRTLSDLVSFLGERYAILTEFTEPPTKTVVKREPQTNTFIPVAEPIHLPPGTLPEQGGGSLAASIAVVEPEIHVFGTFSRIGEQTAVNWARVSPRGWPLVLKQPPDVIARCGDPVTLRARVANGYDIGGPIRYRWFRNDTPLVESPSVQGVHTDTLFIPALDQSLTGFYSFTLENACTSGASFAALVTGDTPECAACSPCVADFDFDGGVTGADMAAFIAAFEVSAPCADVDQDGGVTGGDIGAFFALFEAGGC